jgi:hypothetical protein
LKKLVALVVAGAVVAGGLIAWSYLGDSVVRPLIHSDRCTAMVDGRGALLDPEQAANAALIAAVSVQRGMPAHAATIAIAAAMQESKLYNLRSGDRDSLGLFQQRPSQGWGTRTQILDRHHAINAFYDALDKIDGWETMKVTDAAQEVQHSGYPDAYAQHESEARVLASAFTGNSRQAFSCEIWSQPDTSPAKLDADGLTRRADAVRRDLEAAFGEQSLGGFAPGGVHSGHMKGSAHYEGRAIDVFVRPVSAENKQQGWAIAQYLVAQAQRLAIEHVIFDDRIWTAGSLSADGWRNYTPTETSGSRIILEHRDHVHVDVFR